VIAGLVLAGIAAAVAAATAYFALRESSKDANRNFGPEDVDCAIHSCSNEQSLEEIANAVNPNNSNVNCGNIVDAVIQRLTGADPDAVAPDSQDGSFAQIEERHGTQIEWGHTFEDAFNAMSERPEGTTAILGIDYGNGSSHVVVMTKRGGDVAIVEGQAWGQGAPAEVIATPERANERYNPGGTTSVGYGIVP
jgi:hypothetical protein